MTQKNLVAANWKMHGDRSMVTDLVSAVVAGVPDGVDVLICPPAPYLLPVADILRPRELLLGGQNLAIEAQGAFTGEVSGAMLADCCATHVLVGHSERRALFGETNDIVARKFQRAIAEQLIPVLCVGETLAQRESGDTEAVIRAQLDAVIDRVGIDGLKTAVIAYEPVWAIGTGHSATPEQAQEAHAFIRDTIARKSSLIADCALILYGGSLKADNAASIFGQPDVNGGLVGGASLDAKSFLAICQAAAAKA